LVDIPAVIWCWQGNKKLDTYYQLQEKNSDKGTGTMQLLKSNVGRKVLMAITGVLMILFVIVHLLGNSSIFIGQNGINAYAEHLHSLGPLVWVFRLIMLTLFLVHIIFGIQLTIENSSATPQAYAVTKHLKANFASKNMIWTGLLIACFVVYHLLHFTARVTPGLVLNMEGERFDVFTMVTSSFAAPMTALVYVAAMLVLFLHLFHGAQSFFQTMGWSSDTSLPVVSKTGRVFSFIVFLGYASIPVAILAGILTK
jgi:succinate dehydrogenase / fumarate reductase cytochrome b subunit